jgi:hypothetical protein
MHPYQEMNQKLMAIFNEAGKKYYVPDLTIAKKIKKLEKRKEELKKEIENLARGR